MLKKAFVSVACLFVAAVLVFGFASSSQTAAQGSSTATSQWCKGVNIVFFPGGSPGGSFETVVYNGALQASLDLGANTQYLWSDWDPAKMLTQFQDAMATKPDGIAVMGHPGDEAFKPLIDQAEQQGIIVTSQNTQLSQNQATYASAGFGYSGADLYTQGELVGNEAVSQFSLQAGDEVMVWGLLSQAGRGQRTQGIIDALKAAKITVDYLEIDNATNADPTAGIPTFAAYVAAHPNLKAVLIDHGNLTGPRKRCLRRQGNSPATSRSAALTPPQHRFRASRMAGSVSSTTSRNGCKATCPSCKSA